MSRVELGDIEKLNEVISLFIRNVEKEPAEHIESLERVNKFINDLKILEYKFLNFKEIGSKEACEPEKLKYLDNYFKEISKGIAYAKQILFDRAKVIKTKEQSNSTLPDTKGHISEKILNMGEKFDLRTAASLLPSMDGTEETVKQLIDAIELYADLLDNDGKSSLIKYVLKVKLSQNAKLRLKPTYINILDLVKDIKSQLLTKKSAAALATQMHNARQDTKGIDDYAKIIEQLMFDLTLAQADGDENSLRILQPINEKLAINAFANGLKNAVMRTIIKSRNYTNLKDAIMGAKEEKLSSLQPIGSHTPNNNMFFMRGRYHYNRTNRPRGLLWLYLFHFGLMALSLEPGYLDFDNLPDTNFTCVGKVIGGYYADLEANCQMFHVCTIGQADEPMDIRFLCLNGTVFDQETRVCERIDEVDCSKSEQFYSLNLELYGNSGPILEESPEVAQETEAPSIIIKSTTSTTTTTTTTTKRPVHRPANPPYYSTNRPSAITTAANKPKVVSTHHFPVNAPDIRFNPEEINISLNPGAPPDIRTKHFLQQSFSDSIQDLVNDNANSGDRQRIKVQNPERLHVSSSTSPKSIYAMDNSINQKLPQNSENNFAFSGDGYQTEHPQRQQQFLIQTNSFRHSQSFPPNVQHLANQYQHQHFHSTTAKQDSNYHQDAGPTTVRTIYLHSLKPPEIHQHHHYTHHHRTEKPPQRVQIPIPLLPTLPPLTFSSPAPFTLQRHIEAKRYTKDHQAPPRIIISASASVSDASGRRLNYSLGTIGAAQLLEAPPSSYDDYKDSDVGLDPFYHDVPKVNPNKRKRRSAEQSEEKINPFEIIKDEKEAVEVLKFLFTWYQSHQATATAPSVTSAVTQDLIHKINYELAAKDTDSTLLTDSSEIHFTSSKEPTSTESIKPGYENNELFKKSGRYSIVGGYKNLDSKPLLNNKSSFRNALAPEKHIGRTRAGKNIGLDDLVLDTVPDMRELKEKIDDADVTIVKDLKEADFNPYDYVDDNYEGIVYKEISSNGTKENETNVAAPKKEENIEITTASAEYKSFPVNHIAVAELYKYLNINHHTATENSMIDTFTDGKSENENAEYKHEIINNNNKQVIEPMETLIKDTSSYLNDTNTFNESVKFTEINVLSEVREDNTLKSSTPTSSTTTTSEKPTTRKNVIRRGRGRQRQRPNNYYDAQNTFNIFSSSLESRNDERKVEKEKTDSHSFAKPNSTTGLQSKRSRARGRSRFNDFHSSTSTTTTTTTVPPTSENISESENNESNDFTNIAFATIPPLIESINGSETILENLKVSIPTILIDTNFSDEPTTKSIIVDQPSSFKTDVSEPTINSFSEESPEEKHFLSELDNIFANSENRSSEDVISKTYENQMKNVNEEVLKSQENQFNHSVTESGVSDNAKTHYIEKQFTIEQLRSGYETTPLSNSEPIQVETSSTTSIYEEQQTQFNEQEGIIETAKASVPGDPIQVEVSTRFADNINEEVGPFSKIKDASSLITEFKPVVNTAEDPSYLIKLLRYFAETTMTTSDDSSTIETPVESYSPLTESQLTPTTTERNIDLYSRPGRNEYIEHNRGRPRSRLRYTPKDSTTSLPTLRDVYKHSDRSTENETKNGHFEIVNSNNDNLLEPKKIGNNNLEEIINTTLLNNNRTAQLPLNMNESRLENNIHVKAELELLERLTLNEHNLAENPNESPVTNTPIVDTTVTTPFISFEHAESFGTTISSITDSSKFVNDNTESIKDLTEMFETSTEQSRLLTQTGSTEANKNYYSFYEDVFVVPELTEKTSYSVYTEASKYAEENTETTYLLESTPTLTSSRSDQNILSTPSNEINKVSGTKLNTLDSVTSSQIPDQHDATTTLILNLEKDLFESNNNKDQLHKLDSSTLQPDVEIQKSISLPVTILENSFDISHDITNAQDINNLIPTSPIYETPENLQEYIEDIEVSTKSVVAKGDQVKLGVTEDNELTATETIPTTLVTTDSTLVIKEATISSEEHSKNPNYSMLPEIQQNATEILFVKDTESPKTSDNDSTTSLPTSMPVESPGMINSSHLLQVVVETTTIEAATDEPVTSKFTSTRIPYHTRRTRPPKRRPYNNQKSQFGRHRFSTELFTNKPPKYSEAQYKQNQFTSKIESENITDAPLHRSAAPTRSELKKVSLHTTPLSSKNSRVTTKVNKQYVFNCFGKDKNKFYADPRDCRLFHYCTQGYSKNQLLDLKFVCDQKTFFDDDKLTCTKVKPTRCL